jgi:AcrR family transcriptional regulator
MPRRPGDEVRDAADEIRRETRAAAAEVRIELGGAGRETREALREAMQEVRAAFAGPWGSAGMSSSSASGTRMSRAQRKEMTRELLLDAAIEVFAEKGYHGASLDDVADAAGFTKGAVYSNFTRKADLFRALLERETQRRTAVQRRAVEAVPLQLLPDVAAELLRDPDPDQRDRNTLIVEFWLAAQRDPNLREVLIDATGDVADVLEEKLVAADARTGLSGSELAVIMEALAVGLRMDQALRPDGDQATLYAKAIHKLLADEPPEGSSVG